MVSPSIKLAKSNQSSAIETDDTILSSPLSLSLSISKCDKKICFYYIVIVFVLLLICKPKFILQKKNVK